VHMLILFECNILYILKCQKNSTKKSHVCLHMLRVHKVVSQKNDMSFGLRKKTNFGAKNKTFYSTIYFVFLHRPPDILFFS
jgi:hypothetical protein